MGNFSRTYPIFPSLREGWSVTSLCSHLLHTFSLQDNLNAETKTHFFTTFSSFSIPQPVSQPTMSASSFHRPRSTPGLNLFRCSFSLHRLSGVLPHPGMPRLSIPKTHPMVPSKSAQSRNHMAQHVLGTLWELNTCSLSSGLHTDLAAVKLEACVLILKLQVSALT